MWLVWLVALLASCLAEPFDCPTECECVSGSSIVTATCTALHRGQRFDSMVAALHLADIDIADEWTLTNSIFADVGLHNVMYISIKNASLKSVEPHAFEGLEILNTVNLSGNHLETLNPELFVHNPEVAFLSLRNNPLKYSDAHSKYFLNSPSLRELDIAHCNMSHISSATFSQLPSLEFINLRSNNISTIVKDAFAVQEDLEELDLSDNQLSELDPETFAANVELLVLTLGNNPITSVAGLSIPGLERLDLSYCKLETLSADSFSQMPNLVGLNLRGNSLHSLHEKAFWSLKKLENLDLSRNVLEGALPEGLLSRNKALQTLSLADNPRVGSLPDSGFLGRFPDLFRLDLSRMGLRELAPQGLNRFNYLVQLNLSGNELTAVAPGVIHPKLMALDVSNNKIEQLDRLALPRNTNLHTLHLSGNLITHLDPDFLGGVPLLTNLYATSCGLQQLWAPDASTSKQPMHKLQRLVLDNNEIRSLTVSDLQMLTGLQYLSIDNNTLKCDTELISALQWLQEHEVMCSSSPSLHDTITTGNVNKDAITSNPELMTDKLGWESFMDKTCPEQGDKLEVRPTVSTDREEVYVTGTMDDRDFYVTSDDVSVQRSKVKPDVWPVVVVAATAVGLILTLTVLAAAVMRWTRQRACYQHPVIKKAMSTSRLRREDPAMYEQLYEDPNTPTTPVMKNRSAVEDVHHTFPTPDHVNRAKQPITYLSSKFHHTNIVPDPV